LTSESEPKNVSSIPSGCTHTIFSFHLPSSIPIPDGIYDVRIGKKTADVDIRRIQHKSFGKVQFDPKVFTQLRYDKHGWSSHSFVQIKIPELVDASEATGREPRIPEDSHARDKAKDIALKFVNRLIEVTRHVTWEYWVESKRYEDLLSFQLSYWDGAKIYPVVSEFFDFPGGLNMSSDHPFDMKPERLQELRTLLADDLGIDPARVFLLNSKDACLKEDYRLAIVEAVTALETSLYRFIRLRCRSLHLSEKDLEGFITIIGLYGTINVTLRIVTDGFEQIDDETIQQCNGAIAIRNKILHKGFRDVGATDTEQKIFAIEKMMDYLNGLIAKIGGSNEENKQ